MLTHTATLSVLPLKILVVSKSYKNIKLNLRQSNKFSHSSRKWYLVLHAYSVYSFFYIQLAHFIALNGHRQHILKILEFDR